MKFLCEIFRKQICRHKSAWARAARPAIEGCCSCGGVELLMIIMMIWRYGKQLENCCRPRRSRWQHLPQTTEREERMHTAAVNDAGRETLLTLLPSKLVSLSSPQTAKSPQTLASCLSRNEPWPAWAAVAIRPSRQNELLLLCKVGM